MSQAYGKTVRDESVDVAIVERFHRIPLVFIEWQETADAFPGLSGSCRGREEVQRWAEQAVVEYWASLEMEIEEITETSDGAILLGMRYRRGAPPAAWTRRPTPGNSSEPDFGLCDSLA